MEKKSVDLEQRQVEALEQMVDYGDADNQSEALRTALDAGAQSLGYRNGRKHDTTFRQSVRRMADAVGLLGLFIVGLTFWGPMEWRILVVVPFLMAAVLYGTDRLLARVEPTVSNRLFRRGEKA